MINPGPFTPVKRPSVKTTARSYSRKTLNEANSSTAITMMMKTMKPNPNAMISLLYWSR